MSIDDVSVLEGGNLVFTVSLSGQSYQTVSAAYVTTA